MKVILRRIRKTKCFDCFLFSQILWDFQTDVNLESRFDHGKNFPQEFKTKRKKSDEGEGQARKQK